MLKSIYDFLDPIEWWFLRHQHESMLCQLSINICQLCTADKHCVNYQQKLCQRSTKIVSNSTQRLYTKDYIIMYATTFCHLISKLSLALQITVSCCINFHELISPPFFNLNLASKQLPLGFLCTQCDKARCVDTNPAWIYPPTYSQFPQVHTWAFFSNPPHSMYPLAVCLTMHKASSRLTQK